MSWQKVSLAGVSESVSYGYTASASEEQVGPKFLRITDIVPACLDWDSVPYCKANEKNQNRFSLQVGDIVVARTGATVGYAKQIRDPENAVFASYLVRFRVDSELADPYFVGRLVESTAYKRYVKSQVGGAAQPNANAKVLGRFVFRLPPRSIQRRIASILSAYDDLIENNRRRIALLERAARELYREWFVRLRFPGHEHTKIVDGVPEGWTKKTAIEVANVMSGGTPKTADPNNWGGGIPFFTPKDATGHVYAYETERTLTEEGLKNCNSKLYPKNTIFLGARGSVGKINLAQTDMAMNQTCYALLAKNGLSQVFLYFALVETVAELKARAVGSIFDAIVVDTFRRLPFIEPSESLIAGFNEFATPLLEQIDGLATQNRNLARARDLLLPRLMSGEVAV